MPKEDNLKPNKDTQFSKENQPSGEAKSRGKLKKTLLREISNQLINGESKVALMDLAKYLAVDVDEIDIETAMHLKQMEKALKEGDTKAYNAVMDRIKGKPIQSISIDENSVKTRRYIDATGNS